MLRGSSGGSGDAGSRYAPRPALRRQFRLVRREIKVATVLGDTRNPDDTWNFFLPGHDRLGYVRITSFGDRTADEVEAALAQLSAGGARGLVLDLRDNPGGLLDSAADVAGLFLDAGDLLVTTRGPRGKGAGALGRRAAGWLPPVAAGGAGESRQRQRRRDRGRGTRRHHRATIVGERTYGKGTVQNVIPIEGGRSVLKLTIATYWRPSGKNIHRLDRSRHGDEWGVKPDAGDEVTLSTKAFAALQRRRQERDIIGAKTPSAAAPKGPLVDPQLDRAVECLEKRSRREHSPRRSRLAFGHGGCRPVNS